MRFVSVIERKTHVAFVAAADAGRIARTRGILAGVRFGAGVVRGLVRSWLPRAAAHKTNPVDEQFGTETADNVRLHSLDIASPNYRYGVYYRATDLPVLDEVLSRLECRHEENTFIDYGAGKGLVLLRAAAYPFRAVVGVEFARELHEAARRNVERYPAALKRTGIELVLGDAIEYEPPPGDLVLYLYEPFEAPVTRKLIARIDGFRPNRTVKVAYVWSKNPVKTCKPLWDSAGFLAKQAEGDCWTIYTAR